MVLPTIGLLLFSVVTYTSMQRQREIGPNRYFWWSAIRLDSDPLNKHPRAFTPRCKDADADCIDWQPEHIWIDPGWITKALLFSALPAFLLGAGLVHGLGRLGFSEVTTFMTSMPLLIFGWFHTIGRLIDHWKLKRQLT